MKRAWRIKLMAAAVCCMGWAQNALSIGDIIVPTPQNTKDIKLDSAATSRLYQHKAALLQALGEEDSLRSLLKEMEERGMMSAESYYMMCNYYEGADSTARRLEYAEKAVVMEPDNFYNWEMLYSVAKEVKDKKRMLDAAIRMEEINPDEKAGLIHQAMTYEAMHEPEKMMECWDRYEKRFGLSTEIIWERFATQVNHFRDKKAGIAEYDRAIALNPKSDEYYLAKAKACNTIKWDEETKKVMEEAYKNVDLKSNVAMALAMLYARDGETGKLKKLINQVIDDPACRFNDKYNLLYGILQEEKLLKSVGETPFERIEKVYPYEFESYLLHAIYFDIKNDQKKVVDRLEKSLAINPNQPKIYVAGAESAALIPDTAKAIALLKQGIAADSTDKAVLITLGKLLSEKDQKSLEAIEVFERAANLCSEDEKKDKSTLLCYVGSIYLERGDSVMSIKKYEMGYELDPENADLLNNYSYLLGEMRQDISKAERLAGHAVQLEPDNPYYLDTYARLYYYQGKLSVALLYEEQAAKMIDGIEHQHPDLAKAIYEHMGDIYSSFKSEDKAKEAYDKAAKFANPKVETAKKKSRK